VDAVLAAVTPATATIAIVTPNNPTGGVATAEDLASRRRGRPARADPGRPGLRRVRRRRRQPSADAALALPNALVVRTVSKAWGLAGLRIGYCAGHPTIIRWLRACGGPYPVSGPSLALAAAALDAGETDVGAFIETCAAERDALSAGSRSLGGRPQPSQGNFVLRARPRARLAARRALAGFGIGIRAFPGKARSRTPSASPARGTPRDSNG
jgi:histidinol-phosphate aminotransferase